MAQADIRSIDVYPPIGVPGYMVQVTARVKNTGYINHEIQVNAAVNGSQVYSHTDVVWALQTEDFEFSFLMPDGDARVVIQGLIDEGTQGNFVLTDTEMVVVRTHAADGDITEEQTIYAVIGAAGLIGAIMLLG